MEVIEQFKGLLVGGMAESTMKGWYQDRIDELLALGEAGEAQRLARQFIDDYQSGQGIRNPE
jgi:hypothetical protein